MLYQPTNIYPSMTGAIGDGVIDVNQGLKVSWQVNGKSPMTAFQVTIYKNNANSTQVLTTGKSTANCPFYGMDYSGEIRFFSFGFSADTLTSAGMTNGESYKLVIQQWWSDTASVTQSSASAFITRDTPSVSISTLPNPIQFRSYTFTATYTQAQNDVLNWVSWEIALKNGTSYETLKNTGKLHGVSELKLVYDGFFSGSTYAVRCSVQTENGAEATSGWVDFNVSYAQESLPGTLTACPSKSGNGIKLSFPTVDNIPAETLGDYTLSDSYLHLPSGSSATWMTRNNEPINFEPPFDVVWRGKADAQGTLIQLTGSANELTFQPLSVNWEFGCYGTKFVVSNGSDFYTSEDGKTWSDRITISDGAGNRVTGWRAVCYAKDQYVAVGSQSASPSGSYSAVSTDGETWTAHKIADEQRSYNTICYGNGKYVATANRYIGYSVDGITWTAASFGTDVEIRSCFCAFGNGIFVAVYWDAQTTSHFYTSTDGVTWTLAYELDSFRIYGICFANGYFFVSPDFNGSSANPTTLSRSTDGVTWETINVMESAGITAELSAFITNRFAYVNGMYATIGFDDTRSYLLYSYNSKDWLYVKLLNDERAAKYDAIVGWNNLFVIGNSNAVYPSAYSETSTATRKLAIEARETYTSVGGEKRTSISIKANNGTLGSIDVSNAGSLSVVLHGETGECEVSAESSDLTWSQSHFATITDSYYGLACFGNGMYVCLGNTEDQHTTIEYSRDLVHWTSAGVELPFSELSISTMNLAYGGGRFAIVYSDYNTKQSKAWYSEDAVTWTEAVIDEPMDGHLFNDEAKICYGNGMFLSVGYHGEILGSENGTTWKLLTNQVSVGLKAEILQYGGGKFIAFGSSPFYVAYSEDAINWTVVDSQKITLPEEVSIKYLTAQNCAYGNGTFVAICGKVGDNIALVSTDGENWTGYNIGEPYRNVVFGSGRFLAFDVGNAASSEDGKTWTSCQTPYPDNSSAPSILEKNIAVYGSLGFMAITTENVEVGDAYPSTYNYTPGFSNVRTVSTKFVLHNISKILMTGKQDCDYLLISDGKLSDDAKTQILNDWSYHPYDVPKYFFNDFISGMNGGGIGETGYTQFAIYRYTSGGTVLAHVFDTSPENGEAIIDCGTVNGKTYSYYAFGVSGTLSSASLTSNLVATCFWDWTVLSCTVDDAGVYHPQQIFFFGKNLSSGDSSNNNTPQILQNFTRYPTVQTAPFNYKSGTLSSLVGVIENGKYSDTVQSRDDILNLSVTQNTLFLKNRKGDLMKVRVSGAIEYSTMDNSPTQAQTIKIPWVEVGSASSDSIVITKSDGAWPY